MGTINRAYISSFYIAFRYCPSGSIPKELGGLGALTELSLSTNMLEGEGEASEK